MKRRRNKALYIDDRDCPKHLRRGVATAQGSLNPVDQKWIDALRPYLGGGIVPLFKRSDGSVSADKTLENFAMLKGFKKIDGGEQEEKSE